MPPPPPIQFTPFDSIRPKRPVIIVILSGDRISEKYSSLFDNYSTSSSGETKTRISFVVRVLYCLSPHDVLVVTTIILLILNARKILHVIRVHIMYTKHYYILTTKKKNNIIDIYLKKRVFFFFKSYSRLKNRGYNNFRYECSNTIKNVLVIFSVPTINIKFIRRGKKNQQDVFVEVNVLSGSILITAKTISN